MSRACALIVAVILFLSPSVSRADYYFGFATAQQNNIVETNTVRAVYLGRLSSFGGTGSNPNVANAAKFTSMYGLVVVQGATNVALYGGTGNSSFETSLANGKMFDTGMKFSNATTGVESILLPGPPANTSPFAINDIAGTGMRNALANNGGIDFWLVADKSSVFTAPASNGSDPANFLMRFNASAVPEPSSILLGLTAATLGALKLRRRKVAAKAVS